MRNGFQEYLEASGGSAEVGLMGFLDLEDISASVLGEVQGGEQVASYPQRVMELLQKTGKGEHAGRGAFGKGPEVLHHLKGGIEADG